MGEILGTTSNCRACMLLWRATCLTLLIQGGAASPVTGASPDFQIRALSSRPDTVSGGSVLVQVIAPHTAQWTASLNGSDVTMAFRYAGDSGRSVALLDELREGRNKLDIFVGKGVEASMELVNHSLSGPIFSGVHQSPFVCQTKENGLGPATDADCSAHTVIRYYYKSIDKRAPLPGARPDARAKASDFKPYISEVSDPASVAKTRTTTGHDVKYVIRRETGVINRAVYDIELLAAPDDQLPSPWKLGTTGWNGRLVYSLGGGCGAGHRQGVLSSSVADPLIAEGYAVARATLTDGETTCNDRIAAETLSMIKEHFIKQYGVPVYTIGVGSSTGASEELLIAQSYPGLLDGIVAYGSFPDPFSSDAVSFTDCALLEHAFKHSARTWTEKEKTAVSGFATWRTCLYWSGFNLPVVNPRRCDDVVLGATSTTRHDGDPTIQKATQTTARCDIYDNEINFLGRDSRTGMARRLLDNVGVQYGLSAFNAGQIDAEQFVELNELIGGFDANGQIVDTRMIADADSVRVAYESGLVLTGGGGIGQVPIADVRSYTDDLADVHDSFRSLSIRARLSTANGTAANLAILVLPRPELLPLAAATEPPEPDGGSVVDVWKDTVRNMDHWLDNIVADRGIGGIADRIGRNRPQALRDGCWSVGGQRIEETRIYNATGICNQLYRAYADPRVAAGAPLADDILKCSLKPMDARGYLNPLTDEQMKRLTNVFPTGVCDYTRPGVGQRITTGTWQRALPTS